MITLFDSKDKHIDKKKGLLFIIESYRNWKKHECNISPKGSNEGIDRVTTVGHTESNACQISSCKTYSNISNEEGKNPNDFSQGGVSGVSKDIDMANEVLYWIICNGYGRDLIYGKINNNNKNKNKGYQLQLDYELMDIYHYLYLFAVEVFKNEVDYSLSNGQIVNFVFQPKKGRVYSYMRQQSSERKHGYVMYPEITRTEDGGGNGFTIPYYYTINKEVNNNFNLDDIYNVSISDNKDEFNRTYNIDNNLSEIDKKVYDYIYNNTRTILDKKGNLKNITYPKKILMSTLGISQSQFDDSIINIKILLGKKL